MNISEVTKILDAGKRAGCTEALFTFGEMPEEHPLFREWIEDIGYSSVIDYLIDLCEIAIEYGLLPHSNPGVMDIRDIRRLKPLNASMGLMLETTATIPAHEGSAGKIPSKRIKTIENAGKLRVPFTTGLLIGIGESKEDRVQSLSTIADLHTRYRHIQEVIIQPFAPKPGTGMADSPEPTHQEMMDTVSLAREILPDDVAIQRPDQVRSIRSRRDIALHHRLDQSGGEVAPDIRTGRETRRDPSQGAPPDLSAVHKRALVRARFETRRPD